MLQPEQILLLEDYHYGCLSAQERQAVEQTILANPELKTEAQAYFDLLDGFKGLALETFEDNLLSWEQKHTEKLVKETTEGKKQFSVTRFFVKYRIGVAAAILIMLMPFGYYMILSGTMSEDALFAANFEPYKPVFDNMVRTGSPVNSDDPAEAAKIAKGLLLNEGIGAYNGKDYKKTIQFLTEYVSLATAEDNLDEVRVYLGVSYLIEGNIKDAKNTFNYVLETGKTKTFMESAEWYLALSLLKEKNAKEATKAIRKIAHSKKHKYKEPAAELLPKVEQYTKE